MPDLGFNFIKQILEPRAENDYIVSIDRPTVHFITFNGTELWAPIYSERYYEYKSYVKDKDLLETLRELEVKYPR